MRLDLTTCSIRSLQPDDAAELARHANDRDIWRNLRDRFPHPYTTKDARNFIAHCRSQERESAFAIAVDDRLVGVIGFEHRGDVWRRSVEIGYWLGREHWGRGVASEAVRAMTDWAFATWDVNRVWAAVFAWNPASARVLEKAGFELEGRLRKAATKDDQAVDELIYAVVRDGTP
jgi:ribosomal-protein-alanine N-acetyltransferase